MSSDSVIVSDRLKSIYFSHQNAVLLDDGVILTSDFDSPAIKQIQDHVAEFKDEYPDLLGCTILVEKTDSFTVNGHIENLSSKSGGFSLDNSVTTDIGRDAHEMLQLAVLRGVSDIHIELYGTETQINARIDGRIVPLKKTIPEYEYGLTLISYLFNQLAKEKDYDFYPSKKNNGRIEIDLSTPSNSGLDEQGETVRETRWRISYIPAQNRGGQATLRWLNKDTKIPELKSLGWEQGHQEAARKFMSSASGLCILAGQVGSGKSTSIASMLSELKGTGRAINTVEDPVEFDIGVIQTSVKSDEELNDFIKLLLRHDPDIEMHGEMRGLAGAMAACRKAETGQLVFTTTHTSSAVGVAHTLNEQMKVPLAIIGADLMKLWIYQTLVRCLCPHCSMSYEKSVENWTSRQKLQYEHWLEFGIDTSKMRFKNPNGCKRCIQGEKERTALIEMLVLDDEDRQYILKKDYLGWAQTLKNKGYKTVIDHANLKISRGEIDLFTAAERVNDLFHQSTSEIYQSFFK